MFHFVVGTKAQLIKMAPVMKELIQRDASVRYIDSGQHAQTTAKLRRIFGLPEPDFYLRQSGADIARIGSAVSWYLQLLYKALFRRSYVRRVIFGNNPGICLIHGDTLSTLIGLHLAKAAGLQIAHVEAGLRSRRLFDPFPEEIIRLWCMRQSDMLFAPSEEAERNLLQMKVRGRIVRIPGNTVIDAVKLVRDRHTNDNVSGSYAVATCHRLETISNRKRLSKVIDVLNALAKRMPVRFVVHQPTENALIRYDLVKRLSSEIKRIGLMEYDAFIKMLIGAKCVITDGGSIQEECAYLGKPCLVIRNTTERPDGIGRNVIVWGFEDGKLDRFFILIEDKYAAEAETSESPSRVIADELQLFHIGNR